jgi:MarR family transcriptional regulator for hemolysin
MTPLTPIALPESFALATAVHEFARTFRRAFDRRARALGYTQSQWRVLFALSKVQGTSQAGLADKLEMQPIALARILERMEAAGLVERQPDPVDRRAVKLSLTDAAVPIIKVLHAIAEEVVGLAQECVSDERAAEIANAMQSMRANLERADVATYSNTSQAG